MNRYALVFGCFSAAILLTNWLASAAPPIADPDKTAAAPPTAPPKAVSGDFLLPPPSSIPDPGVGPSFPANPGGFVVPAQKEELIAPPLAERDRINELKNVFDQPPVGAAPAPVSPATPPIEPLDIPPVTGGEFTPPKSTGPTPLPLGNPVTPPGGSEFRIPPAGDFGTPPNPLSPTKPATEIDVKPLGNAATPKDIPSTLPPISTGDFNPVGPIPPVTIPAKQQDPLNVAPPTPINPVTPLPEASPVPLNPAGAGGLSTPVEEPIDAPDPEPIPDSGQPPRDPSPAYQKAGRELGPSRLWMDSSGRFTLNATLISEADAASTSGDSTGMIKLLDGDGDHWDIVASRLSRKDQGFIYAQHHRNEVTEVRDWGNGLRAKFIRKGASVSVAKMTTSNGSTVVVSVDSLNAFEQGIFEALLTLGK